MKLQGLGNQEVMGKLIRNVEIKIGQLTILWDVCATKLTDTVLLGLDFSSAQKGLVDLKKLTKTFGHETVGAEFAGSKANLTVSRVMVPENTTTPYLPPEKDMRINHPWTVMYTAKFVAKLRNIPLSFLMTIVNQNAINFYRL